MTSATRNRGQLFHNADKRRPSQPDMLGKCFLAGAPYEICAWKRDGQLAVSLTPPRKDKNSYPPEAFRGALDDVASRRGDDVIWRGDLIGEEDSFTLSACAAEGKSGPYLTLSFDPIEA